MGSDKELFSTFLTTQNNSTKDGPKLAFLSSEIEKFSGDGATLDEDIRPVFPALCVTTFSVCSI